MGKKQEIWELKHKIIVVFEAQSEGAQLIDMTSTYQEIGSKACAAVCNLIAASSQTCLIGTWWNN